MPVEIIDLLSSPVAAVCSPDPAKCDVATQGTSRISRDTAGFNARHLGTRQSPRRRHSKHLPDRQLPSDDVQEVPDLNDDALPPSYQRPSKRVRRETTPVPHRQIVISSSPLAAPPETHVETAFSSDPFASSPGLPLLHKPAVSHGSNDDLQAVKSTTNWRAHENSATSPTKPLVVDSDPFTSTPAAKPVLASAAPWDPISSSMPELAVAASKRPGPASPVLLGSDSESQVFEDELPELEAIGGSTRGRGTAKSRSFKKALSASAIDTAPTAGSSKAVVTKTVESRADKETKRLEREAAKLEKAREKESAKLAKAKEKETTAALAEVNKVRSDKKISTPEMLVDVSEGFSEARRAALKVLLQDLDVQYTLWDRPTDRLVKWRRKVKADFNEELGYWEPKPLRIEPEKHVLVLLEAAAFVELAQADRGGDLESHVERMRRDFPNHTLIYLIEGMTSWLKKNRTIRNRQFTAAARNVADPTATTADVEPPSNDQAPPSKPTRKRKPKPPPPEYIDEDIIEQALLKLQVHYGSATSPPANTNPILIHHTGAPTESAQWIATFTQHISTIPYRRQRESFNSRAAFCMDSGQVRTGDGVQDTYVRMLQEIARVTAPIAYGIAKEFGSVRELYLGLKEGGPLRLEGLRKGANRDGALSDRAVGQAVSRRVYKVFMGRDASSTDI